MEEKTEKAHLRLQDDWLVDLREGATHGTSLESCDGKEPGRPVPQIALVQ